MAKFASIIVCRVLAGNLAVGGRCAWAESVSATPDNAIKESCALSEEDIHNTLVALSFDNSLRRLTLRLLSICELLFFAAILRRLRHLVRLSVLVRNASSGTNSARRSACVATTNTAITKNAALR
jgi:hypothetical protein